MVRTGAAGPRTRGDRLAAGHAGRTTARPGRVSQFLVTRVVEVAVHGLDLAEGLGRDPWLTPRVERLGIRWLTLG
ncbi:predicted protein [Streptomyces sp. C]|nr:predicted protein [Streptomyces sp. C]